MKFINLKMLLKIIKPKLKSCKNKVLLSKNKWKIKQINHLSLVRHMKMKIKIKKNYKKKHSKSKVI
jgi:hypothetical protein